MKTKSVVWETHNSVQDKTSSRQTTAPRITYATLALYKSISMPQEALLGYHTAKGVFGTIFSF